jgi:hypothetical protein
LAEQGKHFSPFPPAGFGVDDDLNFSGNLFQQGKLRFGLRE